MISVTYDGNDIGAIENIEITDRLVNSLPDRSLSIHKIARADKSVNTSAEFGTKNILILGIVKGGNKYTAENAMATLKGLLIQREKILSISQYGEDVEYTATLNGIKDKWVGGYVEFELSFLCSDPIGYSSVETTLIDNQSNTSSSWNEQITIEGSYKAEPIIEVTVSALTGGTSKDITLRNDETGQGITINRTWTAGEIINIDCKNKTVSVDGSFVEYSGTFPTFYPGTRVLGYNDTLTTRTVYITSTYHKGYI